MTRLGISRLARLAQLISPTSSNAISGEECILAKTVLDIFVTDFKRARFVVCLKEICILYRRML